MVYASEELDLSRANLKIPFCLEEFAKGNCYVQSDWYQVEDYHEAGKRFCQY